jgi:hypothetical protein
MDSAKIERISSGNQALTKCAFLVTYLLEEPFSALHAAKESM